MPVTIFFCYARKDQALLNDLKAHLRPLQRQGLIEVWDDGEIPAGTDWEQEISKHLNTAQIILLLISPDFINSDYCYGVEMKRAIERYERDEAYVIPVILEHVYWQIDPLNKLQALPTDGVPVMSAKWHSVNEALLSVTKGIRKVVEQLMIRNDSASLLHSEVILPGIPDPPNELPQDPLIPPSSFIRQPVTPPVISSPLRPMDELSQMPLPSSALPALPQVKPLKIPELPLSMNEQSQNSLASPLLMPQPPLQPLQVDSEMPLKDSSSSVNPLPEKLAEGGQAVSDPAPPPPSKPSQTLPISLPPGTTLFTYQGHSGKVQVHSVAWSLDGKRLAASDNYTVQIWEASFRGTLQPLHPIHVSSVNSVAWSPDGKRLASASNDKTVQVWDASSRGTPLFTYRGHSQLVNSVAWSPDGMRLASASNDKTVQVWDANDGSGPLLTYNGHTDCVRSVAWSPDGQRLASASYDETVQVWDASTGDNPLIYEGHKDWVVSVAWSPDGKSLASASNDGTVQVWDANFGGSPFFAYTDYAGLVGSGSLENDGSDKEKIGEEVHMPAESRCADEMDFSQESHSQWVNSVVWSPDGKRLALAGNDGAVQVCDVNNGGRSLLTYTDHASSVNSVVWSPDGEWLASASDDGTVRVWRG